MWPFNTKGDELPFFRSWRHTWPQGERGLWAQVRGGRHHVTRGYQRGGLPLARPLSHPLPKTQEPLCGRNRLGRAHQRPLLGQERRSNRGKSHRNSYLESIGDHSERGEVAQPHWINGDARLYHEHDYDLCTYRLPCSWFLILDNHVRNKKYGNFVVYI